MKNITYIETHIVDHCNLNCAGCTHFSPLVTTPIFKNLDEFKTEINRIYSLFPELSMLRLMGGEPLLHPYFEDFCIYAATILKNTSIHIVTNGLLLFKYKNQILNLVDNYNIKIDLSNYGILDVEKLRTEFNNKLIIQSRETSMYNPCLELTPCTNIAKVYSDCITNRNCTFLKAGRLYVCPILANIDYFTNYFNLNYSLDIEKFSIDIFKHTASEITLFLANNSAGCLYCNPAKQDSTRHPFRQSSRELSEWITPNTFNEELYKKQSIFSGCLLNKNLAKKDFIFKPDLNKNNK